VQTPEEENEPASSSESTEAQSTPEQAVAETTPGEAQEEDTSSGGDGGDLSGEAAAQTVQEFYTSAAENDYDRSADLLSNAYRQSTWYSRGIFEGTFDTLDSIEFTQGPVAQVNGNTATVSFSTIAYHTDRIDRRTGTATLVLENGEWKIDSIAV
jgi:serine/threonine-protein kinase